MRRMSHFGVAFLSPLSTCFYLLLLRRVVPNWSSVVGPEAFSPFSLPSFLWAVELLPSGGRRGRYLILGGGGLSPQMNE